MGNHSYNAATLIVIKGIQSRQDETNMASEKRKKYQQLGVMHDTAKTSVSSSASQSGHLSSSPQYVGYHQEQPFQHQIMPAQIQFQHSPISDEETLLITGGCEPTHYENIHSIRSLESFQQFSPVYHREAELAVPEKPRSKSETDKESISSPLWRMHMASEVSSFPYFKPLTREHGSPILIDEDIKYISQSPSSMSKSSDGSSASKDTEGESFVHGESDSSKAKSQIHSHQSFKKILRARYLSSQESTEGLSDIETSKDDDAVFEMEIQEEPVCQTIPEVPEQLKPKSASVSGPISVQQEPLDLSRALAVFRDLPAVTEQIIPTPCRNVKYQDIGHIPSDTVTVSPRWRKPVHTHVPSPLVTSSAIYTSTCISSPQYLIPAALHTTVPQLSPGISPISPRYSPGRSPPTFQGYVHGPVTPSPSPQEVVKRQSSDLTQHTKSSQKFVFPPPSEMLEGRGPESKTMFSCPICTQVFPSYDNLAKHMAKHLPTETVRGADNSKIHYCKVCNRAFSRSDMLTRHMRLHTGLKPYECKVCGQVFSRSDHLNTHQRTHTGEKPYHCPQCPYAACRRDMITRHMRIHLKRWTKRSPFSSSSSEESPHQWSVSSRSSSESTESHSDRLLSGSSESDRMLSVSSMDSSELSPRQSCSVSSMDSVELEMTTQQQRQQSWALLRPAYHISSDQGEHSDSTIQHSLGSTPSSRTSNTSLSSSDNNNASTEDMTRTSGLPERFRKCSVQTKDNSSQQS